MADSDDDMPPPLEDMTDHVKQLQSKRDQREGQSFKAEEVQEVRLKPTVIPPTPVQPVKHLVK